jgi:hypothetical protein
MRILIVVAPTFSIARSLAEARGYEGEWRHFSSSQAADAWIERCAAHGLSVQPVWITYQYPPHPDKIRFRLRDRSGEELRTMLASGDLEVPEEFTVQGWTRAIRIEQRRRASNGRKGRPPSHW